VDGKFALSLNDYYILLCVCVCVSFIRGCVGICMRARVILLIQYEERIGRITLSFVTCLAPPNFSKFSHQKHDFLKNVVGHKMCFEFLYKFCLKRLSF
jgi:hypothetical protein